MTLQERIAHEVEFRRSEIISLMQKLVQTESTTGNELRIGQLVAEECRKDGLEVEVVEPAPGRLNVVAKYSGAIGSPKVMMYSHLDTVPPGNLKEWTHPPYSGHIADGYLWGRGASDDKLATCGLIMAFRILRSLGLRLKGDIIFTHVGDEEKGGGQGFRHLVDKGYGEGVDSLFYGHGGSADQIGIASNGSRSYTIRVKGRAAHTARLEQGVNAVVKAAKLILKLNELGDTVNNRRYHLPGTDTIMRSRFSINRCNGYVGGNIVPDVCDVVVDRRFTPGETAEQTERELRRVVEDLKKEDTEFDAEISFADGMALSVSPADSEIVKTIQRVAQNVLGVKSKPGGGSHSSDHGWFANKHHKPLASYGVGGEGTHMVNERVKTEDLLTTTKVYALFMTEMLGVQ